MAQRVLQSAAALCALALAVLLTAALIGAPPARAGSLPSQILGSTTVPHATTSVTSAVPPTSVKAPPGTGPATTVGSVPAQTAVPTTSAATTTVTAPRVVAPVPANAPPTYSTYTTAQATTTVAPTTTTTIAPLGNSLPASPATLPLRTTGSNAHVNPVFAVLSGIGFFVALLIVAGRLLVTRSGGPDRRPLPGDDDPVSSGDQLPVSRSS